VRRDESGRGLDFKFNNLYKFRSLLLDALIMAKLKSKNKTPKKAVARPSNRAKSLGLKAKPARKPVAKARLNVRSKVESRRTAIAQPESNSTSPQQKVRSKQFASAVHAYEAGIKLMHSENFDKAIKCFETLIADHPEEPEIQERTKVLIHACEKKISDKGKSVLRSAEDYYNVGIANLNNRQMDSAMEHLQHALKLAPKADHILYALAAASAVRGDREQALNYLKQSIQYRPENRFMASRDTDFGILHEDAEFKQLVTPPEK
jgi:tetratricopeptide (TPR) repeat protein